MASNKAKKQHYVPQFLLKKFAVKRKRSPQVWVMDKANETVFLSSPRDIAHENKFYECEFGEDHKLRLEEDMQKIDDKGSSVINQILASKSLQLSDKQKTTLSYFVAFQVTRTISPQKNIQAMREYIVSNLGPNIHLGSDPKVASAYGEKDDKQTALGSMISNTPDIAKALQTRSWFLCESPKNSNFIISDNPVVKDNSFDQSPYGNLGILSPGIEMYLPLSPRYCLYIICPELASANKQFLKSQMTGSPLNLTPNNIKRANSLQVLFAERFIISKSKKDLDIAIEMIKGNPGFKKGFRPKIN